MRVQFVPEFACSAHTLLEWVRKHEIDTGLRDGVTSEERERIKAMEHEIKELRKANEILKLASAFLPRSSQTQILRDFIDWHRNTFGVEPICKIIQIDPSGYWRHAGR